MSTFSRVAARVSCLLVAPFLPALLTACSPALDWRELQPAPPSALHALMPCKPDNAVRTVPLGAAGNVEMHLSGCDAAGATFVLGWATVPAANLGAALGAWQDATLARAGIAAGPDGPVGRAFVPPGAVALPQAMRIEAVGKAPDGSALPLQAAWFATVSGAAPQVFFAAVYGQPRSGGAPATFFGGLRLR